MKKIILITLVLLTILFSGCVEQGLQEIGVCLDKCSEVCDAVEQSDVSMNGYTITLQKQSGGVNIDCGCPCSMGLK